MDREKHNADDIKKIQKEQFIIKDQLSAVSNTLNNLGEQMRNMRSSIEHLRYERTLEKSTVRAPQTHCTVIVSEVQEDRTTTVVTPGTVTSRSMMTLGCTTHSGQMMVVY